MPVMRVVAIVLLVAGTASADDKDKSARAAAAFEKGQKEQDAGHVNEACDLFQEALNLDPTLGTKLNLASCRELQGRLIEAYYLYAEAAEEAVRTSKEGRATYARDRIEALGKRLAIVKIKLAEPDRPGQEVRIEAPPAPLMHLAANEWTKPRVIEPGQVTVEVVAPERVPFHAVKYAKPGEVTIFEVPPLSGPKAVALPPQRSKLPWIVGGSGAGLLVVSALLGLHAQARYYRALAKGGDDVDSKVASAQLEADVATGVLITGAVAIGVGVGLYIYDRRRQDHVAVVPTASPGSVGFAIIRTW
jgi:tetratricopeptide (TPR) repeat protein